jgi:membrane-anchored mycosin MYCP
VINDVATSWSTAVVSGVLSLLRSAHPKEEPAQTVARLLETANGTAGTPTRLTGYGVVQPLEALTRPLSPDADGTLAYAAADLDQPQATAPEPADDLLAGPRDDAVWWGLIGGGVLVVALLLRPVLSRRD